jgi:hypothetical protein
MTENLTFFEAFTLELGDFLGKVQLGRSFDVAAFKRLDEDSRTIAKLLKNRLLIPRFVLNEMRTAMKILRAEAPYMPNEQCAMNDMADRLEMTFDLILLGEDHEDRIPGTPRIL